MEVKKRWPGENLPKFDNDDTKKELNEFVTTLKESCQLLRNVGQYEIRDTVIKILRERRRQIRVNKSTSTSGSSVI